MGEPIPELLAEVVTAIKQALQQIGEYGTIILKVEKGAIKFIEYTGSLKIPPAVQTE